MASTEVNVVIIASNPFQYSIANSRLTEPQSVMRGEFWKIPTTKMLYLVIRILLSG